VRDLVGMMLDDDYMVLEAVDAEQALNMWQKHRPDAIVLDYKLPDMDGIEMTRKIRTDEGRRHGPILMVTGMEDPAIEVEGLLAGVDDYIIKPFDEDVFIARLQAMLRRKFAIRPR
jgi:DNA-binding response OmpR family regulator